MQELVGIDNDVKSKNTQYNQVKTNLTTLQRKQTYVSPPDSNLELADMILVEI